MKDFFASYYPKTKKGLQELWDSGLFVFDASVLLKLYALTATSRRAFVAVLTHIAGRVWVPHQAAAEYYRNRCRVINDQIEMADALLGTLKRIKKDVRNALPKEHPFVDEKLIEEIVKACQKVIDNLRRRRNKYQHLLEDDNIREELGRILSGRVGEPYDTNRLVEICDIARKRYSARIPPGYADENKTQGNPFGDVIIWMQILDKAKIEKCPIIFVTDDRKEDWWVDDAAGELNPRQELVDEMQRKARVMLHMYTPETFLEDFNIYFKKPKVSEGLIEELAGLGVWNYKALKQAALQARAQLPYIYQLSAVLDQILDKQIQLSWPLVTDAFRSLQTHLQSPTFPWITPSWLKPYPLSSEKPPESGEQDVEPKNSGD